MGVIETGISIDHNLYLLGILPMKPISAPGTGPPSPLPEWRCTTVRVTQSWSLALCLTYRDTQRAAAQTASFGKRKKAKLQLLYNKRMKIPVWVSYSLFTWLASIPLFWLIQRRGGAMAAGFQSRLRFLLWVPGIVALGFRVGTGRGFSDLNYGLGRGPYLLVALLLPLVVEVLLIGLAVRLGWSPLAARIVSFREGMAHVGPDLGMLIGGTRQSISLFTANLLLSVVIGTLFNAFFTFGAEFGWRGFLQGEAIGAMGLARGLIVVGLAWGVWNYPLVRMGFLFPEHPKMGGLVLMPVSTIALSVVAGWLYQISGTLWAPTLFHAAVLTSADLSLLGLEDQGKDLRVRGAWVLAWVLVAILGTVPWPM